jgi:transketolase
MHKVPGVEASTGSLGHGLPFGVGVALSGKLDHRSYKVYVLIGDGECQEGSVWEASMFASQHELDNLVVIIDSNKIQAMDYLDKIVSVEPLAEKWRAFGWEVREVDGHDFRGLQKVFAGIPFAADRPSLIIAHTVKGKGVSFMENTPIWHYRMPGKNEMEIACKELDIDISQEET